MSTKRDNLVIHFAAQRKKRQAAISEMRGHHIPARKRSISFSRVLVALLIVGILTFGVSTLVGKATMSGELSTLTEIEIVQSPTPIILGQTSANEKRVKVTPTESLFMVCTKTPEGRLHVRFEVGSNSEVRGYLVEGETVWPAIGGDGKLISKQYQSSKWLYLQSPIIGWVNSNFICEGEQNGSK
jgi:hypothetical protein